MRNHTRGKFMLACPDADLVRRDPTLPGLGLVLDGEALLAALRRFVPAVEGPVTFHYLRYKPGTSCLAGFEACWEGERQYFQARAHQPGSPEKLSRRDAALCTRPLPLVLADQAVVLSVFPDDRRLPSLKRLAEGHSRRQLLSQVFPDDPEFSSGQIRCLRYKPERRYVGQLVVRDAPVAVVKLHRAQAYEVASEAAKRLQSRSILRLAARIGQSTRHGLVAQQWLPGELLETLLARGDLASCQLGRVGAAIAELHDQPSKGLAQLTRQVEWDRLEQAAQYIAALWPPLERQAGQVAREIGTRLVDLPPQYAAIHGDFYARQVLLDEATVNILDLDEAVAGDPAADLGNFLAHLQMDAVREKLPDRRAEAAGEAVCEGYRGGLHEEALARVSLYVAAGLIRLAPHLFRERYSDWPDRLATVLLHAERMLWRRPCTRVVGRPAKPPRRAFAADDEVQVSDPFGLRHQPEAAFLAGALDPWEAAERLAPLVAPFAGNARVHLREIRVVRVKPQRRCLIAYQWQTIGSSPARSITVLGKVRFKGLDGSVWRLQKSLWQAGFDDTSEDGVSIPAPVGVVERWRMWLQRQVDGTSSTVLLADSNGPGLARRIADAIHKLHRSGPPPRRRHTLEDELRILQVRLAVIAEQRADLAHRLARIIDACRHLAVPHLPPCPIHRDFYADHVLVAGDRLHLLDLDLYCEGNPALDVGNFCAHLTEQSLRTCGRPDALADRERALQNRFTELAGEAARPAVDVYTVLALARHIQISTLFPERQRLTTQLIALCEQRLGLA